MNKSNIKIKIDIKNKLKSMFNFKFEYISLFILLNFKVNSIISILSLNNLYYQNNASE